jgi:protein TonB
MNRYILIVIVALFNLNSGFTQVVIGDTTKSSTILPPVLHVKKSHTLKRKKSKKEKVVKTETKTKDNTNKVAKVDVVSRTKTAENPKVKKKEKEPEVVAKTNTVAVVLPESCAPTFKGGKKAMTGFINQNLIYPNNADKNGIRGTVDFSCIVTKDGKLKDIKMIKALGFGCNEEALRLVKLMPDWDPGRANNQAVDMPAVFSITFKN